MDQITDLKKKNESIRSYQTEIDSLRQQIESMGIRETRERPEMPTVITFKPPLPTPNRIKVFIGFPHEDFDEFK